MHSECVHAMSEDELSHPCLELLPRLLQEKQLGGEPEPGSEETSSRDMNNFVSFAQSLSEEKN